MRAHLSTATLVVAAFSAICAPAAATLPRTFVASFGTDTGSCTAPAPCRSFTFAITQTTAGGELIVADTAGYGPVTINQAVSIVAPPGVYAGVTVTSGDGIKINASPSDDVVLRGLTINGAGGARGIVVLSAASVHIDGVVVSGFLQGIDVNPTVAVDVFISDSVVRNVKGGVRFAAQNSAAFLTHVQITRLRVQSCGGRALLFQDIASSTIVDSVIGACGTGIVATGGALASITPSLTIDRSVIADNGGDGVTASGSATESVVNIGHSVVFGNGTGVHGDINGVLRVYSDQLTANGFATTRTGGDVITLQNNFRGGNVNGDGDPMQPQSPN